MKNDRATNDMLISTLSQYDVILPSPEALEVSVAEHYRCGHYISDLNVVQSIIENKYPEMKDTFISVINNSLFYPCNMLVCRKELFNEYARWLFDILFEAEGIIQKKVQHRVYGFLSERLLTVYFQYKKINNQLKIKKVPVKFYNGDPRIIRLKEKIKRHLRVYLKINLKN